MNFTWVQFDKVLMLIWSLSCLPVLIYFSQLLLYLLIYNQKELFISKFHS